MKPQKKNKKSYKKELDKNNIRIFASWKVLNQVLNRKKPFFSITICQARIYYP
jgi:hypothetical protein